MNWSVFVAVLAVTTAACTKKNPAYCSIDVDCSNGTHCDVSSHMCIADGLVDGGSDSATDLCLGEGKYRACFTHRETAPVVIEGGGSTFIDTGSSALCLSEQPQGWLESGQRESCFILGGSIDILNRIEISGPRPLVLAAFDSIHVSFLDAASHSGGNEANAMPDPACQAGVAPLQDSTVGGGGAGGSFMTRGGDGGASGSVAGGASANAVATPTTLRAGCLGQLGAKSTTNLKAGGGGAVYLVAGRQIDMRDGTINVSGAAGNRGGSGAGGGGGGSGGMLVMHAPIILSNANTKIMANGGGGSAGTMGEIAGHDPDISSPTVPGPGGAAMGACSTNSGGNGYASTASATNGGGGSSTCSGGGGGGGAGFIQSNVALMGTFSPEPVIQ